MSRTSNISKFVLLWVASITMQTQFIIFNETCVYRLPIVCKMSGIIFCVFAMKLPKTEH